MGKILHIVRLIKVTFNGMKDYSPLVIKRTIDGREVSYKYILNDDNARIFESDQKLISIKDILPVCKDFTIQFPSCYYGCGDEGIPRGMHIMEGLLSTNATTIAGVEVQKFPKHVVRDKAMFAIH